MCLRVRTLQWCIRSQCSGRCRCHSWQYPTTCVCRKHNYTSPKSLPIPIHFEAIDLWAAGVVIYIKLTGLPPYDQASMSDQRFQTHCQWSFDGSIAELSEDAGDVTTRSASTTHVGKSVRTPGRCPITCACKSQDWLLTTGMGLVIILQDRRKGVTRNSDCHWMGHKAKKKEKKTREKKTNRNV